MNKDGQNPPTRPKTIRRRRTTASIGGTTQSAFANQSMSSVLAQQQGNASGSSGAAAGDSQASTAGRVRYCEASLNYSDETGYRPTTVEILDGRTSDVPTYERCGFQLLDHRSSVRDWRDEQELTGVHGPEVETLAQEQLGCDTAIAYPPLVRSPQTAKSSADYAPIEFVHSDYSADYRPMIEDPARPYRAFIEPLLEARGLTQADLPRAERVAVLQFWRNIGAELPDYPLAFCDASSVDPSRVYQFVVDEYGGMPLAFETTCMLPPAASEHHDWYCFPGMTTAEVVAFRTYDSRCVEEDRPLWTPHSAFRDPHAGADAPRRESLEMRVLCLWGV
ncbi:MAG: CmcJ/NvfI family oxidoreductase [Pseudomonadota bacterium]